MLPTKTNFDINPTYFGAVLNHYCHQNSLIWSRVQTLVALQVAALTGIYTTRDAAIVWFVAGLSLIMTLALYFIFERDVKVRDLNFKLLCSLGNHFEIKESGLYLPPFTLSSDKQWPAPFGGVAIFRVLFLFFLVVDIGFVTIIQRWPWMLSSNTPTP
jgi:hypothetical protein